MLFIEIPFATPLYHQALIIRNEELRIPLGLAFSKNDIAKEYNEVCLGALSSNLELHATLNFSIVDNAVLKMRQVAVLHSSQGKGIGNQLVRYAEKWARNHGFSQICLHARSSVLPFYTRMGYQVSGAEFKEVDLPHRYMSKTL